MQYSRTTQVPNILFDCYLKNLKSVELKILLVIIRKTLGWKTATGIRKKIDWISSGQLRTLTGGSRRAITKALNVLTNENLIEVFHVSNNLLTTPLDRKGKPRLFYRLSALRFPLVDIVGNPSSFPQIIPVPSAHFAQDLRTKSTALAQKMRITKETLQN